MVGSGNKTINLWYRHLAKLPSFPGLPLFTFHLHSQLSEDWRKTGKAWEHLRNVKVSLILIKPSSLLSSLTSYVATLWVMKYTVYQKKNSRSWHFGNWHSGKSIFWELTFWELTFWELTFWELKFWEEPGAFITHTHVHNGWKVWGTRVYVQLYHNTNTAKDPSEWFSWAGQTVMLQLT